MRAFSFDDITDGKGPHTATAPSKDVDQDPYCEDWFIDRIHKGTWCSPLEPWTLDLYPKTVYVNGKRFKVLTPWVVFAANWGVCKRVKEIIEDLEPGKHQFIPVNLHYGTKGHFEIHTYYTLQVNNMCNDVDVEKSNIRWNDRPGGGRFWCKKYDEPVALPAQSISGKHIWRNQSAQIWVMSGEPHDALQKEGLSVGLKFQEQIVV
jgi:hypothetical protein